MVGFVIFAGATCGNRKALIYNFKQDLQVKVLLMIYYKYIELKYKGLKIIVIKIMNKNKERLNKMVKMENGFFILKFKL